MLKLIVLGHVLFQDVVLSKLLYFCSLLKDADKASCVLFKLFWLDFFVSVDEIDALIEMLNLLTAFIIFASFILV